MIKLKVYLLVCVKLKWKYVDTVIVSFSFFVFNFPPHYLHSLDPSYQGLTYVFNTSLMPTPNFWSSISSLMWASQEFLMNHSVLQAQHQGPIPTMLLTPNLFIGRNLEFLLSHLAVSLVSLKPDSISKIPFRTKITCKSKFVIHWIILILTFFICNNSTYDSEMMCGDIRENFCGRQHEIVCSLFLNFWI